MAELPSASSDQPDPPPSRRNEDGMVSNLCDSLPLPHQDVIPTLRDLSLLPVPNWYLLGLQLGVSADELDVVERNYPRDNHMCKVKMFGAWLRMDTSATYEKLARALVTVGKRKIAEAMCTARGIPLTVLDDVSVATVDPLQPTPTLSPDPPECVAKYVHYLKDKYRGMPTLPDGDWPPSLGMHYTRLAMIERKRELPGAELVATMERDYIRGNVDNIVKRKKAIQLPEAFLPNEDGGQLLKILMDGAPGVGKSTLSRKICKDWASGELLQQYNLVILLPLRQTSIREATSIEDLIEADDPSLKLQIVQHFQRTSGEHVMLIVDGYDELRYEDRTQNSLILDILRRNKFPKCSVLVTSRPYASDYLQRLQTVNRHIEVLGFTEEHIEQSIMVNVPDKAKATELVQTLKERQDIASLCYIPLNCAIVLYVYEREQCTLPHSLTKLYETFILNAVKRDASITGNDPRNIRRIYTLATIPEPLQQQLNALSKLAYGGLVADKMVFSIDDIEAVFPDCGDLDIERSLLGLMTVFKGFTSTGVELSYQFLHLTIQEFLAARWAASQLSADELFKFFQDHLREERYRMVLLFLAGISRLKFPSAGELHFKHHYVKEFLFLSHLIYESQNFSLFHNLATAIDGAKLSLAWCYMFPFDCLVVAHFLAWCDGSLKLLDLRACGLTDHSIEIMYRVNSEHHGTTQIEEVNLSYNPEIITEVPLLPKLPMFEHTRKLTVQGLEYPEGVSHDQVAFHCLLNMRHLTTLKISVKEILDSSEMGYSLSLDKTVLQCRNGNSQHAVGIFSFLEHNTSLEELDLLGSWQLAEGDSDAVGCAIERMLNMNRTLKVLNLSGCNVKDPVAKHIASGLTKSRGLVTLDIQSSELSGSCAVPLLHQMTTHPTLNITVVELNVLGVGRVRMDRETIWCVIGVTIPESCVEFFRALNDSGMTNLNVVDLTDPTAEHFAVGLAKSQSVQALDLRANSIGSAGTVSILRSLEHNTSLKELDLSANSQLAEGDSEAVGCAIERMLKVNKTLKILNLRKCELDTAVATSIFKSLEYNTSLEKLDLSENSQLTKDGSVAVCCTIERMLNVNRTLKVLNLSKCKLDTEVATSIFRSLEHNTSLEKLDLSENSQLAEGDSDAVGCAIERMLNVNRNLKVLNLGVRKVTDPIAKHILTGLTKNMSLKNLYIVSCALSVDCAVPLLQQMTNHPTLSISAKVNVQGVGQVIIDRETLWCVVGDTIPENCVKFFRALNNSGMKVSKLKIQDLTDQTAEQFAVGLAESQSVQVLKLICSKISSTGAVSIFRSLEHNTSLEELDLSGNSQLAEDDSEAVGCAIERMLNVNRTLKVLNLCDCGLDTAVATHVFRSLEHNTTLVELDLFHNRRLVEGDSEAVGCAIEKMLKMNRTLKVLNLHNCGLYTAVATHIAAGLTHNVSLAELDISTVHENEEEGEDEFITNEGCIHVFKALHNNTALKKLDISPIVLGIEGSVALAEMLSCNKTLIELTLMECDVPEAGLREIAKQLLHNSTLQTLKFGNTQYSYLIDEQGCGPLRFDKGDLDLAKFLTVVKHCDETSRNSCCKTPIHWAALNGHLEILKFFITDLKCSPNIPGQNGSTPLHYAAERGYLHIMKYLIDEQECDPSCLDKDKETPLHSATAMGHLDIVKYLTLEKHCNPTSRNSDGTTPIHWAAHYSHLEILKFFITDLKCSPNIPGKYGRTPLHYAAERGYLHIMKYLIDEQECDPSCLDKDKETPLHSATAMGHLDIVKCLTLEKHCNPTSRNSDGTTPIHWAAQYGHLEILKFFIADLNCNPNIPSYNGRTPLHYAAVGGHLHIMKYLIDEQECDPSCLNRTPLHCAACNGHLDIVKFLTLEKHCNPNQRTIWKNTPLHLAAAKGHLKVVQFFVEKLKCSSNIRNQRNATPHQMAETKGHHKVALYLQNFQHSNDQ